MPLTTLPLNLTISLLLGLRLTLSLLDDPSYVIISFSWRNITNSRYSLEALLSPPYPYLTHLTFLLLQFDLLFLFLHLVHLLLIPPSTPTTLLTPRISLPSTFPTVWILKKRLVFLSFSPRRAGLPMDQMSCSWRVLLRARGTLGKWARVWGRLLCRSQLKLIFTMHRYQKGTYYHNNPFQTEMTQIIDAKSSFAAEMILLFSWCRGLYALDHWSSWQWSESINSRRLPSLSNCKVPSLIGS